MINRTADAAKVHINELKERDGYLERLYNTLEMCGLVLQNSYAFSKDDLLRAPQIRKETEKRINECNGLGEECNR